MEIEAPGPEVGDGGQARHLDAPVGEALDALEEAVLPGLGEGQGDALAAGAAHPADAVDVGLGGRGHVVVDDVGEPLDVQAPGGDVGGHHDVRGAALEAPEHLVALGLGEPAVERLGAVAPAAEGLVELVHLVAGAAEDDGGLRGLEVEEAPEGRELVAPGHHVGGLAHLGEVALRRTLGGDLDLHRIGEVPLGDAPDPRREGGGEQRGLVPLRELAEDGLDVVGETHVEHLVGLVEDDVADLRQRQAAAAQVVQGPPRGGHDHVHPAVEGLELVVDGLAAVDREHGDAEGLAVAVHRLGDLHRQLPGGDQDQGRGRGPARALAGEPLEQGQGEGGGLAGAGGGLAHEVPALEERRDGGGLDGRGLLVAELAQGLEELGLQAQIGEGHGVGHGAVYGLDARSASVGRATGLRGR